MHTLPDVRIAPDLASIVTLGVIAFNGVRVVERDDRLDSVLAEAVARMIEVRDAEALAGAVRGMYRRLGIDPTKTRPSSEALLRRVRRGDPFPRVNSLVDVCNWCSLELRLPYGLYDLGRIDGAVELRRGRAGEQYEGIRKDVVHLEDRPALVDARGPFGNPTSDSARTRITPATSRALVVIFAPRSIERDRLAVCMDLTAARVGQYTGATEAGRATV